MCSLLLIGDFHLSRAIVCFEHIQSDNDAGSRRSSHSCRWTETQAGSVCRRCESEICEDDRTRSRVHCPVETCRVPVEGSWPVQSWDWEARGHVIEPAVPGSEWRSCTLLNMKYIQHLRCSTSTFWLVKTDKSPGPDQLHS